MTPRSSRGAVLAALAINVLPPKLGVLVWTGLAALGGAWRTR
jgi:hypothetical protein